MRARTVGFKDLHGRQRHEPLKGEDGRGAGLLRLRERAIGDEQRVVEEDQPHQLADEARLHVPLGRLELANVPPVRTHQRRLWVRRMRVYGRRQSKGSVAGRRRGDGTHGHGPGI